MATVDARKAPSSTSGGEAPTENLIRFSGTAFVDRDLDRGEEVTVQVFDTQGTLIADCFGKVGQHIFRDRYDEDGDVAEVDKIHGVKVS